MKVVKALGSLPIIVTFLLALIGAARASATVDPELVSTLGRVPPNSLLDVRDAAGNRFIGHLAGIQESRLVLHTVPAAEEEMSREVQVDLADIDYLARRQGAASTGFGTGFTTGAMLVGSLSLLFGLALDSLDGEQNNTSDVLGIGLAGGIAGGTVLGLAGAGIGALIKEWDCIYRSPALRAAEPDWDLRHRNSLALGVGVASGINTREHYSESGPFASLKWNRRLGKQWEVGPEIAFFKVGGTHEEEFRSDTYTYTYQESVSDLLAFNVVTGWCNSRKGWSPFMNVGFGLYVGGGEFPGLSIGGGLSFRDAGGREVRFELRDHLNLSNDDHGNPVDNLLTAGAVFSFSL